MENVITSKWSNIRSFLNAVSIVLVTVTIIVVAMPNTEKPRLQYTIDQPWMNAQLISPGNIMIKKDPKLVAQEQKDALANEYIPYFKCDKNMGKRQVKAFLEKYGAGIPGVPAKCMQIVAENIASMYETGIIAQLEYHEFMAKDSLQEVMRVTDNEGEKMKMANFLPTKLAYEHLFTDERLDEVKGELQKCNLNEYLRPNITYDAQRSEQVRNNIISTVSPYSGEIKQGQEIINRGNIVTEEKARMIDSYNDFVTTETQTGFGGLLLINVIQWLYVMSLMILFMMYLQFFRKDYLSKPRSLAMVYTLLTIFPVLCSSIMRFDPRNVYILPICLVPMFIRVFLDSRTAFMVHTILVLICAATVSDQFEFIVIQITGGVVTICSLRELYKRSQLFSSALFIIVASIIMFTTIKFLSNKDVTFEVLKHPYFCFIFNGVLLLLTYPLMFIVEKTFGFISPITLFELSDVNRDLLRKLSEEAPGTFQHSIMVSNLAAAIASEIGAKSLLVRTGALYHDIGKLSNPAFFTENQRGVNPHEHMEPQESAQIIVGHIKEGLRLATEHNVPDVIRNFILTHHGKGVARYFYTTYRNAHPDEEVDDKMFRYAGPNPFSLEQAILMMADGVEAASRSLPEYTEESINNLVNKIIDTQVAEGYFSNCPITFRDIATAKRILNERLKSTYHTRIQYPTLSHGNAVTTSESTM